MPDTFRRLLHEERRALMEAIKARKDYYGDMGPFFYVVIVLRRYYLNARKRWIDARKELTIYWNTWNTKQWKLTNPADRRVKRATLTMGHNDKRELLVHVCSGYGNVDQSKSIVTNDLSKAVKLGRQMMDANMSKLETKEVMTMIVIDVNSGNTIFRQYRDPKQKA